MSRSTSDAPTAGAHGSAFAMFVPVTSTTGALEVTWAVSPGRAPRIWVLLADPARLTPDDLHPQRLLPHLLRIPVPAEASSAVVHVPVGRPLGVCIVGRDENDAPQSILPAKCDDVALNVDPVPAAKPEKPNEVTDAHAFVLAPGSSHEAMAALAARLAASAPTPAPGPVGPTGFGLRQQWYLSRVGFTPRFDDAPRVVIRRTTFISADDLQSWQDAPPTDAIPVAPGCDGVIDAETPEDTMAFFAVLDGPRPWTLVPLGPVPPPFETMATPCVLGDAKARLDALERRNPSASAAFFDILAAARRGTR